MLLFITEQMGKLVAPALKSSKYVCKAQHLANVNYDDIANLQFFLKF